MEGQTKFPNTLPAKIILPKGEYVSIFRNSATGGYYGKLADGTIELIGGFGSGNFIAATGSVVFAPGAPGITFIDTPVPEAIIGTSIVLITENGVVSTNDFSYTIPVNGTLRIYSSNGSNGATIVYTIIN